LRPITKDRIQPDLPITGLWAGVDNRLATLGINAFPDIGLNKRPAGLNILMFRLALEHPEDGVAAGMNGR